MENLDLTQYPYPLAKAWNDLSLEKNPLIRLHRSFDAFETIVRFCANIVLKSLRTKPLTSAQKQLLLRTLSSPALGNWIKLLELAETKEGERFVKELYGRSGFIQKTLVPYSEGKSENLVYWRNQTLHSQMLESECAALLKRIEPIIKTVFQAASWVKGYPLAVVHEGLQMDWMGHKPAKSGQASELANGVYLFSNDTENSERNVKFLRLDPFHVYRPIVQQVSQSHIEHPTYQLMFYASLEKRYVRYHSYEGVLSQDQEMRRHLLEEFPINRWQQELVLSQQYSFVEQKSELLKSFQGRDQETQAIVKWLRSESSHLFLYGRPGIGKSALMAQMDELLEKGIPEVHKVKHRMFYFFNRNDARCTLDHFIEALALKLREVFEITIDSSMELSEKLSRLRESLAGCSEKLQERDEECLIVLDGVDEALLNRQNSILENVPFLGSFVGIRWLLTGREQVPSPYSDIKTFLQNQGAKTLELSSLTEADIAQLFQESLDKYPLLQNPDWEKIVALATERSEGNPLYLKGILPDLQSKGISLDRLQDLPLGLNGFFQDNLQQLGVIGQSRESKSLILTLAWAKTSLPIKTLTEFSLEAFGSRRDSLETWETKLDQAIDRVIPFLNEDYLPDSTPVYQLYHAGLRDFCHTQETMQHDLKTALKSTCDCVCQWNSLQNFTREYALKYAAEHLHEHRDKEMMWQFLASEALHQAQIAELFQYQLAIDSINQGIALFAADQENISAQDASRLSFLVLKSCSIRQTSQHDISTVWEWAKEGRIEDALSRLAPMNEKDYFKAIVYLLWLQSVQFDELQQASSATSDSTQVRFIENLELIMTASREKLSNRFSAVNWSRFLESKFMAWWAFKIVALPNIDVNFFLRFTTISSLQILVLQWLRWLADSKDPHVIQSSLENCLLLLQEVEITPEITKSMVDQLDQVNDNNAKKNFLQQLKTKLPSIRPLEKRQQIKFDLFFKDLVLAVNTRNIEAIVEFLDEAEAIEDMEQKSKYLYYFIFGSVHSKIFEEFEELFLRSVAIAEAVKDDSQRDEILFKTVGALAQMAQTYNHSGLFEQSFKATRKIQKGYFLSRSLGLIVDAVVNTSPSLMNIHLLEKMLEVIHRTSGTWQKAEAIYALTPLIKKNQEGDIYNVLIEKVLFEARALPVEHLKVGLLFGILDVFIEIEARETMEELCRELLPQTRTLENLVFRTCQLAFLGRLMFRLEFSEEAQEIYQEVEQLFKKIDFANVKSAELSIQTQKMDGNTGKLIEVLSELDPEAEKGTFHLIDQQSEVDSLQFLIQHLLLLRQDQHRLEFGMDLFVSLQKIPNEKGRLDSMITFLELISNQEKTEAYYRFLNELLEFVSCLKFSIENEILRFMVAVLFFEADQRDTAHSFFKQMLLRFYDNNEDDVGNILLGMLSFFSEGTHTKVVMPFVLDIMQFIETMDSYWIKPTLVIEASKLFLKCEDLSVQEDFLQACVDVVETIEDEAEHIKTVATVMNQLEGSSVEFWENEFFKLGLSSVIKKAEDYDVGIFLIQFLEQLNGKLQLKYTTQYISQLIDLFVPLSDEDKTDGLTELIFLMGKFRDLVWEHEEIQEMVEAIQGIGPVNLRMKALSAFHTVLTNSEYSEYSLRLIGEVPFHHDLDEVFDSSDQLFRFLLTGSTGLHHANQTDLFHKFISAGLEMLTSNRFLRKDGFIPYSVLEYLRNVEFDMNFQIWIENVLAYVPDRASDFDKAEILIEALNTIKDRSEKVDSEELVSQVFQSASSLQDADEFLKVLRAILDFYKSSDKPNHLIAFIKHSVKNWKEQFEEPKHVISILEECLDFWIELENPKKAFKLIKSIGNYSNRVDFKLKIKGVSIVVAGLFRLEEYGKAYDILEDLWEEIIEGDSEEQVRKLQTFCEEFTRKGMEVFGLDYFPLIANKIKEFQEEDLQSQLRFARTEEQMVRKIREIHKNIDNLTETLLKTIVTITDREVASDFIEIFGNSLFLLESPEKVVTISSEILPAFHKMEGSEMIGPLLEIVDNCLDNIENDYDKTSALEKITIALYKIDYLDLSKRKFVAMLNQPLHIQSIQFSEDHSIHSMAEFIPKYILENLKGSMIQDEHIIEQLQACHARYVSIIENFSDPLYESENIEVIINMLEAAQNGKFDSMSHALFFAYVLLYEKAEGIEELVELALEVTSYNPDVSQQIRALELGANLIVGSPVTHLLLNWFIKNISSLPAQTRKSLLGSVMNEAPYTNHPTNLKSLLTIAPYLEADPIICYSWVFGMLTSFAYNDQMDHFKSGIRACPSLGIDDLLI